MNSDRSSSSPRRGRRHRSGGAPRRPGSDRQPERATKPSLWQRIVSFFTGGKKSAPSRGEARPERRPASENDSEPARFSRKPEVVDVTTPRLYVGNLSFDAAESDLTDLFNGVGIVVTAEVVTHRGTERSKGFGFVQMQTVSEAQRAVNELHDRPFMGRKLVVSGAKALEDRAAA